MKKAALKTGRLNLKKMTIAELSEVNGGIQATTSVQPTTTVQPTHQVACITNSAICPGPTTTVQTRVGCVHPTTTVQPSFVC